MAMKTKTIILFMLIFIPFLMNGQNHFTDGMKWRTQVSGTHSPNPVVSIEVVTIEKTVDDNCFNLYSFYEDKTSDKELIAVIKTENDKVFFKPERVKTDEWYLLYDFSLKPGDGCFVYTPFVFTDSSVPYKTYVKCVGIEDYSEGGEWSVLLLEEYEDDTCSFMIGNGSWIKGLSSLNGFLYNNRFGVDGRVSKLLDVSDNGKILFSNTQTGVLEITDPSITNIKVNGLDIYISVNDDICGSLYSQDGMHMGNYKFSKTPTHIRLSNKGVYILKTGNTSRKIFVP